MSPLSTVPFLGSLPYLGHAAWETLAISLPAVYKAQSQRLTRAECDEKLHRWSERLLDFARVELEVIGLEHLPQEPESLVVVSNHQSLYDIPVLYQALPLSLRMAAKMELFKTPIWGQAMRAAGFVEIDRKNREKAYGALRAAGEALRERGLSLHVAPEGTRSKTGVLGPFKRGAFELAQTCAFRVAPVCISGAINVHRSGTWEIHPGQRVTVTILPLLIPKEGDDAANLRDAAHTTIATCLATQNVMPV